MPRVDSLLISSDFDTLKNDASGTATLIIPANDPIGASVTKTYDTTVAVGQPQSILVVSVTNNVLYPNGEYASLSNSVRFDRTGKVGGVDTPYSIILRFAHSGGNNVRLIASIFNNAAGILTTGSQDVFTFRIRTIKAPRFA